MTHSNVTWLILTCLHETARKDFGNFRDVIQYNTWQDSLRNRQIKTTHDTFAKWLLYTSNRYEIWIIHLCDMIHSYMWHDSFVRVTWRTYVCDMTHFCITCKMTHGYVVHMSDMTHTPPRAHKHTHARTQARTHARTHACTHTCTHPHTQTHKHTWYKTPRLTTIYIWNPLICTLSHGTHELSHGKHIDLVMAHIWIRHGIYVNASCQTYVWNPLISTLSHGTHIESVMAHILIESWHTYWLSHGKRMNT